MAMAWLAERVRFLQRWVALPQVLVMILVVDVAAYFAGLVFWYGPVMTDPVTPAWAWPFIPDCPLFGLLGGLALLIVTARRRWNEPARRQMQDALRTATLVSLAIWFSTTFPGVSQGWAVQSALWALWSGALLVAAIWFRQASPWLLGLIAFGQIKYGIWTITAWLLYWRSTAALWGSPHFSPDSVLMTLTHIGLAAQGVLLLSYFRPTLGAALVALIWFGWSDFVDYGLGYYPAIPEQFISLPIMQWSTMAVTGVLTAFYVWLGRAHDSQVREDVGPEQASQYT
jgi:uncharacterized membrane protein YpjA